MTDKQTDRVRRIVPDHSKLKPFHFQIKTYYQSDANYQRDNPSQTDNPSLSAKTAISVINECRAPASSWAFACVLLFFTKINFKLTVDIPSMCKTILEVYKKYYLSNVKIFQKNYSLFHPEMILTPLFCFKDTKNTGLLIFNSLKHKKLIFNFFVNRN